jgi:hypothetical protein
MKVCNIWKCFALLIPAVGICGEFENLRARYAAEQDEHRSAAILREANAPSIVSSVTTSQVITARDARLADREAKYLAELASAGLSVTNDFDAACDALNAGRGNADNVARGLRLFTLIERIKELGGDPKASTGLTHETNIVTTATFTSPAMQALGRAATAEDLK